MDLISDIEGNLQQKHDEQILQEQQNESVPVGCVRHIFTPGNFTSPLTESRLILIPRLQIQELL